MSDEVSEAIIGDAVAASLEKPGRKRRGLFRWRKPDEPRRFTHCEDCGAELHGRYCSDCGQVAVDYHRSFRHVIADVAESFLNWDSKFTKTIGLLLIFPGWLTNQFVAGRRTRYLHPLRLYLLVSIVFFFGIRLMPIHIEPKVGADLKPEDRARVEEAMKNPDIPPFVREQVLKGIAERTKASDAKKAAAATPSPSATPAPAGQPAKGSFSVWLKQRVREKVGPNGSNVQMVGKALRDNVSTMMLFCIPLFALVLKILYLRQGRFYIEHLVYALHIHSFFYIAVLLTELSKMAAKSWAPPLESPLSTIFGLAIALQVFLSVKQVYRQSWPMTTVKCFLCGVIYGFVLILALAATGLATLLLP